MTTVFSSFHEPERRSSLPRRSAAALSAIHPSATQIVRRFTLILALALADVALAPGQTLATPDAPEPCECGRAALLSGDHAQAVKLLEKVVESEPGQLDCWLLLAQAYELSGRPDESKRALQEIVKRQPRHRAAAMALARRCFDRLAYAKVIEILEPLRAGAGDYELCHLLGTALFHEGKLDEARRSLTRAVASDATHPQDHSLLGSIAMEQGRFALAVEAYERANRLGRNDAVLHFELATAYFRLRNYLGDVRCQTVKGGEPDTIAEPGYLIEFVPGECDVFRISPPRSAVFHARMALYLGLDSPKLHLLWADIWLGVRRYARAVAAYSEIETRVPPSRRGAYCYDYARALLGAGDAEGYLARLQEAAKIDPAAYVPLLGQAYMNAAEVYNQEGNVRKHIEYMRLAVQHSPTSSDLRYRLGNALWEDERREEAALQWRILLELQPDHRDRTRLLGLIQATRTRTTPAGRP